MYQLFMITLYIIIIFDVVLKENCACELEKKRKESENLESQLTKNRSLRILIKRNKLLTQHTVGLKCIPIRGGLYFGMIFFDFPKVHNELGKVKFFGVNLIKIGAVIAIFR